MSAVVARPPEVGSNLVPEMLPFLSPFLQKKSFFFWGGQIKRWVHFDLFRCFLHEENTHASPLCSRSVDTEDGATETAQDRATGACPS